MVVVSEKTKKTYDTIISALQTAFNDTTLDLFLDADKVINYLETTPTKKTGKVPAKSSLKTYFIAIKSTLKDDPKFAEVIKKYDEKMMSFAKESAEEDDKQELSAEEQKKWLCWTCIVDIANQTRETYEKDKTWRNFQYHLIICLYTMLPPVRLDYSPMIFTDVMPKEDDGINYCVLKGDKCTFILNSFKTKRSKGQLIYDAPENLVKVLQEWRKLNHTKWLLRSIADDEEPMTTERLGVVIPYICNKYTGIPATLNIFRHSLISHLREGEMSLLDKRELARIMGHSTTMSELYRRINA